MSLPPILVHTALHSMFIISHLPPSKMFAVALNCTVAVLGMCDFTECEGLEEEVQLDALYRVVGASPLPLIPINNPRDLPLPSPLLVSMTCLPLGFKLY